MNEQEVIQKAIRHFECMRDDAVVVLDSGFGTHPGESDLLYRNRKLYAELAISALEEIQQYRDLEQRLKKVYGECDGLLESVVAYLEKHAGVDIPSPVFKVRLLTDDDVDRWDTYKSIGTVEECRAAVEKQTAKKPLEDRTELRAYTPMYSCPNCGGRSLGKGMAVCHHCGQKIDWSEEI